MNLNSFQQQKTNKIEAAISISDWLQHFRHKNPLQSQVFVNSIWVLLSHVLGQSKSWLVAHVDEPISSAQLSILNDLVIHLTAGAPLAYLIGSWSFYGLDFLIDESVLIPRPETELLVEKAIAWLKNNPNARSVLDVGTGSGCIAITLASIFPDLKIIATDLSFPALNIARKNILLHSIINIELLACDLINCMERKFNLICANPPYIPTQLLRSLPVSQFEPWIALNGGENGMDTIFPLLEQSSHILAQKGLMLMEIESTKKIEVMSIARDIFPNAEIHVQEDLAGNARLLMIKSI